MLDIILLIPSILCLLPTNLLVCLMCGFYWFLYHAFMTIELCVYNCFCLSSHNACINLDYPKVKNYLNFESMDNVSFIHGVQ